MAKHLWMQDLSASAKCPKCGESAFKRSNTRTAYERLVRKYSNRAPYRCHHCWYRALLDPSRLRYSSTSQTQFEELEDFASPIVIPSIRIDGASKNEATPVAQRSASPKKPAAPQNPPKAAENNPEEEMTFGEVQADNNVAEGLFPQFDDSEHITMRKPSIEERQRGQMHPAACPKCGARKLYRSHSRTMLEALIKKFSSKRIYRCHQCEWRGWMHRHM